MRLLIVDEQPAIRQLCAAIGGRLGLECAQLESGRAALEQMSHRAAELILADLHPSKPTTAPLQAGGSSGLELLEEVKRRWPLTEVALMSSYASMESAVQAMRLGAYDFVAKPFRVEEFQLVLERMAEKARLVRENKQLRNRLQGRTKPAPCTDLEELERLTVQRVFEQVQGDKEKARRLLGISRATLYRKIKQYGIGKAVRKKGPSTARPERGAAELSQK
jgi:DNA-binding NtrC family response regulator